MLASQHNLYIHFVYMKFSENMFVELQIYANLTDSMKTNENSQQIFKSLSFKLLEKKTDVCYVEKLPSNHR